MINKAVIFGIALALCACAGTNNIDKVSSPPAASQTKDSSFWITLPKPGELVIIGVSGPQMKHETEIAVAREDAARKAAMYHNLMASYVSMQSVGSGFLDYYADSDIRLDYDQQLEKYLDKLEFDPERDVMTTIGGAIFIRFSYPAAFPGNIGYTFGKNADGSPEWINRRPSEIGGFMTGVGFARRQLRQRDTVARSCEAAAAALVSQVGASISTRDVSAAGENLTVIRQRSTGRLINFLVLEIWIDPESDAVWTLAIAKNAQ